MSDPPGKFGGSVPWFWQEVCPLIQSAYPGVPPWEWYEHPDWLQRALMVLEVGNHVKASKNKRS